MSDQQINNLRQTGFKTIPDQTTLKHLERDLSFHPSKTKEPVALSQSQIEAYNTNGYLKGIAIFDEATMAAHRQKFDDILVAVLAAGQDSYSIISAHLKYQMVYDLLTHPKIVNCVKDILGENVVGWGAHYFCKMPGDGKVVAWHQDASYWPLTPSKTCTAWLAIDDADVDNGCMRFISGSHHVGHLTYRMSEVNENNVLNQAVDEAEKFGTPVDVVLKAGEISLHSDLLLHGSNANTSKRRRCGLTLRYCATDVRSDASLGWHHEGVIVSGTDPEGHWGNPPRPAEDWQPV